MCGISGGRTTDHHEPAPLAAVSNTDEPWLKQPGSGTRTVDACGRVKLGCLTCLHYVLTVEASPHRAGIVDAEKPGLHFPIAFSCRPWDRDRSPPAACLLVACLKERSQRKGHGLCKHCNINGRRPRDGPFQHLPAILQSPLSNLRQVLFLFRRRDSQGEVCVFGVANPDAGMAALARKTSAAPTSAHQTGRAGCADQLPGFIIDSVDLLPEAFIQGRVAMSRTLVWQPAIAYRPIFNVEPKLQMLQLKSRLRWLCESLLLLRAAK